jgi:hypothetical protein
MAIFARLLPVLKCIELREERPSASIWSGLYGWTNNDTRWRCPAGATVPRKNVSERGILQLNETYIQAQLDKERSSIMSKTSLVRLIYPFSFLFTPTRFGPAMGQRDQGLVLPDKQRNWFPTTLALACDPILNSNEECPRGFLKNESICFNMTAADEVTCPRNAEHDAHHDLG